MMIIQGVLLGKLAELRELRESMEWDHPDRIKTELEINKIEKWCIDNKMGNITKLTTWNNGFTNANPKYPYHTGYVNIKDIKMVAMLNNKGINYNFDNSIHNCELC